MASTCFFSLLKKYRLDQIDLSLIPLQFVRTIVPKRVWGGHFHTFAIVLPTLTWRHCLLGFGEADGGLQMNQVAHQAGAYLGFCSMKRLRVFLLPLDGMVDHRWVNPSIKFTDTQITPE